MYKYLYYIGKKKSYHFASIWLIFFPCLFNINNDCVHVEPNNDCVHGSKDATTDKTSTNSMIGGLASWQFVTTYSSKDGDPYKTFVFPYSTSFRWKSRQDKMNYSKK